MHINFYRNVRRRERSIFTLQVKIFCVCENHRRETVLKLLEVRKGQRTTPWVLNFKRKNKEEPRVTNKRINL